MNEVLNELLGFSVIILEVFSLLGIILIVEVPFGAKLKTNKKNMTIISILFVLMELLVEEVLKLDTNVVGASTAFIFIMVAVWFLATEKRIRATLLTIPAVFVSMQWTTISDLLEMLFGWDRYFIMIGRNKVTPLFYPTEIVLFILLLLLRKYANQKSMKVSLTIGEGIFLTIFCCVSICIEDILESLEVVFQNGLYNFAWVVFMLALNIAVVYGIAYRKRANYYKSLSESYRQHFDEEYTYFKEYKDTNQDMVRFRHDWNNHMLVMQQLMEEGKYEEAKSYFASFPVVKKGKSKKLLTGNETVDTIFAAKSNLFEEYKIEQVFEGSLARLKYMEPVDICILFSNLVDNAIEAAVKYEGKRYFYIQVTDSPNMLMITLKNSMHGELEREGDNIKTTKTEKGAHGIGLQNVEEIVAKYKGEYYIEAQDGQFIIKLVLPM